MSHIATLFMPLLLTSHIASLIMLYNLSFFGIVHRDGIQKYVGMVMEFIEILTRCSEYNDIVNL